MSRENCTEVSSQFLLNSIMRQISAAKSRFVTTQPRRSFSGHMTSSFTRESYCGRVWWGHYNNRDHFRSSPTVGRDLEINTVVRIKIYEIYCVWQYDKLTVDVVQYVRTSQCGTEWITVNSNSDWYCVQFDCITVHEVWESLFHLRSKHSVLNCQIDHWM